MNKSFKYLFHSGKNSKIKYYLSNYFRLYLEPRFIYRLQLKSILKRAKESKESDYITKRVNYYCKLDEPRNLDEKSVQIKDFSLKGNRSVYFFDTFQYIRHFSSSYKFAHLFGDVIEVPKTPSIVKSRPINGDNRNSVVLNLDKVRHFTFINDHIKFENKQNIAIFRGEVNHKPHRIEFCRCWYGSKLCDVGAVDKSCENSDWLKAKITLFDHLKYKFIVCLEGNDVASNLKWVMGSNSIAIMPKPKYETWFMEGQLVGGVHYIEIKDDYSDLEEKIEYYSQNIDQSLKIIENANLWCKQFKNKKREKAIALTLLQKYFDYTK